MCHVCLRVYVDEIYVRKCTFIYVFMNQMLHCGIHIYIYTYIYIYIHL
jgi:hypothetical protein